MAQVEQIKLKRAGVGVRVYDPERAYPGFTLFAPMTSETTVYLVDLDGGVVHTWELPYPPGLYGYLTDTGTLFYNGKVVEQKPALHRHAPVEGRRRARSRLEWAGPVGGAPPGPPS